MIYLDNASTTPVYPQVVDLMNKYYKQNFFNASATYKPAIRIHSDLDEARKTVADMLGAKKNEIFFTSCATESNNWIIKNGFKNKNGNMVVSAGEHACVYESALAMQSKGYDVRFARLLPGGAVDTNDLLSKIDKKTCLVSVMHVSNETGVINDIGFISQKAKKINQNIVFHSDGVQAFLKIPVNVKSLGVDAYSISGHKFHAPKGIGALYLSEKIHLSPYINGGGQENGMRSGTENVAGIMAMAEAAKIYSQTLDFDAVTENYRYLLEKLVTIPECTIIGDTDKNSRFIAAASFAGCKAEILQTMLADENIYVGRGSACSSHHSGNRVLSEMGLPQNIIDGTLRFSLSPENTKEEIDVAIKALAQKIQALRGNKIG